MIYVSNSGRPSRNTYLKKGGMGYWTFNTRGLQRQGRLHATRIKYDRKAFEGTHQNDPPE